MSGERFDWSQGDRIDTLRRLYLTDLLSAGEIADVLGCKVRAVIKKVQRLGLAKMRPDGARLAELRRAQAKAIQRAAVVRRERAVAQAVERAVARAAVSDGDLIARALAAGRITVLPAGIAAGLSSWERATGRVAAPPTAEYGGFRYGAPRNADISARYGA